MNVNFQIASYGANKNFTAPCGLNAIEFYNGTDLDMHVNGRTIPSGASWSLYALKGEQITTRFEVIIAAAADPKTYTITQKIYV